MPAILFDRDSMRAGTRSSIEIPIRRFAPYTICRRMPRIRKFASWKSMN